MTNTNTWIAIGCGVVFVVYAAFALWVVRSNRKQRCPSCGSVRQYEMDFDNYVCNACGLGYTTSEGERQRQARMLAMHKAIDESCERQKKDVA